VIRLRGVIRQGLTGRRRRWIPLNKPETEVIVRNKRGSKMNRKGQIDDYYLRCALPRLPSASSAARRLLLLLAMILGFALIGKRKPEVGKDLKAKGLVKSWGHLRFYL
jgi:hypothetical protein